MKKLLIATTALALTASPAYAQLLGGGLGGGLGSTLDISGTISRTTSSIDSTTRGAVNGSIATEGNQSVDRRSGKVEARRSADIAGAVSVAQLANTPIAPIGADASGSGNASGNGEAQAQLIGTDAVGSVAGNAVGQARATAGSAQGLAASAVGRARGAVSSLPGSVPTGSGSVSGEGSGSGEGSASLMSTPLAVAGSAAGAAQGATSISPGMPVVSPEGLPIGKVRQIVANSRGQVQEVVVSNGDVTQTIPAANLAGSGKVLIAGEGSADAGTSDSGDEPA